MIVTFAKEALSSRPEWDTLERGGFVFLRYAAKHEAESRGKLGVDHVQQIEIGLAGRVVQVFAGRTAEIENIPSFIGENDRRVEMLGQHLQVKVGEVERGMAFSLPGRRRAPLSLAKAKFSTARWDGLACAVDAPLRGESGKQLVLASDAIGLAQEQIATRPERERRH